MQHPIRRPPETVRRRGITLILSVFLLVGLFAFLALAIDTTLIERSNTRLQAAADAAALAALDEYFKDSGTSSTAQTIAIQVAEKNLPDVTAPVVASNIIFGKWDSDAGTFTAGGSDINAVKVIARRPSSDGNALPLIFARVLGKNEIDVEAEAIAVFNDSTPQADILPLALREPDFGSVDPNITEVNPDKDGPSKPANGQKFSVGENVTLFIYGKGKKSPVHLTLDIEHLGIDTNKLLTGQSSPTSVHVKVGDEFHVYNEGTGSGGFGSHVKQRLDFPTDDSRRTVTVPIVEETADTRNSSNEIAGKVRIAGFVKVHLDAVIEVDVPDPEKPDKTITIEILTATVLEEQIDENTGDPNAERIRLVR